MHAINVEGESGGDTLPTRTKKVVVKGRGTGKVVLPKESLAPPTETGPATAEILLTVAEQPAQPKTKNRKGKAKAQTGPLPMDDDDDDPLPPPPPPQKPAQSLPATTAPSAPIRTYAKKTTAQSAKKATTREGESEAATLPGPDSKNIPTPPEVRHTTRSSASAVQAPQHSVSAGPSARARSGKDMDTSEPWSEFHRWPSLYCMSHASF